MNPPFTVHLTANDLTTIHAALLLYLQQIQERTEDLPEAPWDDTIIMEIGDALRAIRRL